MKTSFKSQVNFHLLILGLVFLIVSLSCSLLTKGNDSNPSSTQASNDEQNQNEESSSPECIPDNWNIVITAIEQNDLGNGTKLIVVRIGIENNDMFWGSIKGPSTISSEGQNAVYITTKDGSKYNYLQGFLPIPSSQLTYQSTGWIGTVPIPPGFAVSGQTWQGKPYLFNFAFQVPLAQEPETISISGLEINCILPHTIHPNGMTIYGGGRYDIAEKTFNLSSDVENIRSQPVNKKFPNLIGSKLEMPERREGIIEFTNISREGELIVVTYNFTNLKSEEASPYFNGYILGDSGFYTCLTTSENDCDHQSFYTPVQPGETAQGLTWSFTVPEDDTNLVFVYVFGDVIDVNEVYRIAP